MGRIVPAIKVVVTGKELQGVKEVAEHIENVRLWLSPEKGVGPALYEVVFNPYLDSAKLLALLHTTADIPIPDSLEVGS